MSGEKNRHEYSDTRKGLTWSILKKEETTPPLKNGYILTFTHLFLTWFFAHRQQREKTKFAVVARVAPASVFFLWIVSSVC